MIMLHSEQQDSGARWRAARPRGPHAVSSSMASLVVGPATLGAALSSTPWYVYVLGVGTAVLAHATDTAVKRHDRRAFERTNKGMYLEFTTKLGMHSPIEPGHRTPTSYLDDNT